jgi:hypothetical protein
MIMKKRPASLPRGGVRSRYAPTGLVHIAT